MANVTKVAIAIAAVLVAVLIAVYMIWLRPGPDDEGPVESVEIATPTPLPEPTPSLAERLSARLATVTLNTSDDAVRDLVAEVSSHPKLLAWMANEDLVRRFTAAVNNVAEGGSPRANLEFMRPSKPFRAIQRNNAFFVDPASYHRYDTVADVFVSLDNEGTFALYRELKPLIDDANAEIAPRGQSFDDRLLAAIDHLLATPVIASDVQLEEKTVTTFAYVDERYESLSVAQRQFLRMGPDNVNRVQDKLREAKGMVLIGVLPE